MASHEEIIMSFTSHKARLPLIDDIFKNHVEVAETLGMHLCFSCQEDSIPYLTEYQKELIDSGKVELLHIPNDHGSNTKWTLCRQAHPDAIMVVVDDDWTYDIKGIKSLLEVHQKYPNDIICRAFRHIPWIGLSVPLYEVVPKYSYPKTATAHIGINRTKDEVVGEEKVLLGGSAYPEHFLGTLYPPRFPKCRVDDIPIECYTDDDIFIGAQIAVEERNLIFAGRNRVSEDREHSLPMPLFSKSRTSNGKGAYIALQKVQEDLLSHNIFSSLGSVYLLTCKKYPKRRECIKKELGRLGIKFHEQFDDGTFMPTITEQTNRINRCFLAKYNALTKFMATDSNRVTIVEDDVKFINDISVLSAILRSIPEDFGACRLSWAPSPFIRKDMKEHNPLRLSEIDKALSQFGNFWAKCPYASSDGCTIISREVAEAYLEKLDKAIRETDNSWVENSDDLLCRVCEETNKPMYVYKPVVCIQVQQPKGEHGKSSATKWSNPSAYPSADCLCAPSCFQETNRYSSGVGNLNGANDGFGYATRNVRRPTSFEPIPNPPITSSSSPVILPRIGGKPSRLSNW